MAAHSTGIGAFSDVTLGYYDRERKGDKEIPVSEQAGTDARSRAGRSGDYLGAGGASHRPSTLQLGGQIR